MVRKLFDGEGIFGNLKSILSEFHNFKHFIEESNCSVRRVDTFHCHRDLHTKALAILVMNRKAGIF